MTSAAAVVRQWVVEQSENDFPEFPESWDVEHWLLLAREHPGMHVWIAGMPRAPEAVVRELAVSRDWRVRHRVAMKRNLPRDLFATLAADTSPLVRMAVAENAKVPKEVLKVLSSDPHEDVARAATYAQGKKS